MVRFINVEIVTHAFIVASHVILNFRCCSEKVYYYDDAKLTQCHENVAVAYTHALYDAS